MYTWQIITLLVVAAMAALSFWLPAVGKGAKLLRFLLAWIVPYAFITIAFTALFMQGYPVAIPFFISAALCFVFFLKKKVE